MHDPLDDPDGGDAERHDPSQRPWRHPSEVGQAQRGRTDRRRGAALATGLVLAGVVVLAAGALLGAAGAGGDDDTGSPVAAIEPSVASVSVVHGEGTRRATALVLDRQGHLVVRGAALAGAKEVWVSCGDRSPQLAQVLAVDPTTDVAVLQVGDAAGRPVLRREPPTGGDQLLAARSLGPEQPLELEPARVASGGVDAGTVTVLADTGASDGALFDGRGRLVGLVVAGDDRPDGSPSRLRALPAARVLQVAEQLAAGHPGGWIGVSGTADVTDGARITAVRQDGPASAAGVLPGDVVVAVDATPVADMAALADAVHPLAVGTAVVLTVRRGGSMVDLPVTIGPRPTS